jgi:hypothetical protein
MPQSFASGFLQFTNIYVPIYIIYLSSKLLQLASIYVFFSTQLCFGSAIVGWISVTGRKHGKLKKYA